MLWNPEQEEPTQAEAGRIAMCFVWINDKIRDAQHLFESIVAGAGGLHRVDPDDMLFFHATIEIVFFVRYYLSLKYNAFEEDYTEVTPLPIVAWQEDEVDQIMLSNLSHMQKCANVAQMLVERVSEVEVQNRAISTRTTPAASDNDD